MSQQQIQEGEKRAKDFVPHRPTKDEMPDPEFVQSIVLKGISGPSSRRLAIINGRTFERGEEGKIKVGQRSVAVKCVEIKENSVVVQIEDIEQPKEIGLK
jgi:hypothetical protein